MLEIIQNNINKTPQTLHNLVWAKIINGIELNNKELEYLKQYKIKDIVEFGLIENGCWFISAIGDKSWYKFGKRHREDGPAVEWPNGYKAYFINGLRHRENGPAIEHPNGGKEYYINGKKKEKWLLY